MKPTLLTALITAAATVAGMCAKVDTASAITPPTGFSWDNSWTQSAIQGKSQTGFDDTPFQQFVQAESVALPNSGQFLLNPDQLRLKYDYNVSAYFINEGAGYKNQLGFAATGTTNKSGLIFNDVSGPWDGGLQLGDKVSLGNITAGTQLDLWLRADGYNRGDSANIFGTQTSSNADGLQHAVAYAYNNYILVGFEDLFGDLHASGGSNEYSDRDFNDVVVVLDIGERNVSALVSSTAIPEPSVTLSALAVGVVGMFGLRRRRQTRTSN